jgi:hypothetical protein
MPPPPEGDDTTNAADAGPAADAGLMCEVAPTDNVSFEDCHAQKDGVACAAGCGRLPRTGTRDLLSVGCSITVTVGLTTTAYTCVSECSVCQ